MDRRHFLGLAAAAAGAWATSKWADSQQVQCCSQFPPAAAVIPVVGDGKWIWTSPPSETGYLEPRSYQLDIGVELQGEGDATQLKASTPVPLEHAEQSIEEVQIETEDCDARLQQVGEGAAQLLLAAARISRGQMIRAIAHYKLTLKKQYQAFEPAQFPDPQPEPPAGVRKLYLNESPGIQTRSPEVRKLSNELGTGSPLHPWDQVQRFYEWGRENIEPQVGKFIGVVNALKRKTGDCEELAGVFVALCRSVGIPARLVWVPNHNWAEFYLTDHEGQGHWIPAHTACYSWFGWTGVHELVIQKGDRVTPPHESKPQRLIADWGQWKGKRPTMRWLAELKPLPPDENTSDAGPGARRKVETGEWKLSGNHPLDRYMRNG